MNLNKIWNENWDLIMSLVLSLLGFGAVSLIFFAIAAYRSYTIKSLSKWRWWIIIGLIALWALSWSRGLAIGVLR